MCRLRNIALESVTEKCDRRTDRPTDGQTTDKVIPMCRYASQATQKMDIHVQWNYQPTKIDHELHYVFTKCTLVQLLHYILNCKHAFRNDISYLVLLDTIIMLIYQQNCCLKYKLFGVLSKFLASLMRNYFPIRPSGIASSFIKIIWCSRWFSTF